MSPEPFKDRTQAGQKLAHALMKYAKRQDVIVFGLPRGGVPVAYEVARKLGAPMDVLIVRKLGVTGWEELAMGAIATGDITVINEDVVQELRITPESIEAEISQEKKELHRREMAYRGHTGAPDVKGKTVIVIDDGIATGSTMEAALRGLRQLAPRLIVMAVPVASPASLRHPSLSHLADEFVTLIQPDKFTSVGSWYENFAQTSDKEVTRLLEKARCRP